MPAGPAAYLIKEGVVLRPNVEGDHSKVVPYLQHRGNGKEIPNVSVAGFQFSYRTFTVVRVDGPKNDCPAPGFAPLAGESHQGQSLEDVDDLCLGVSWHVLTNEGDVVFTEAHEAHVLSQVTGRESSSVLLVEAVGIRASEEHWWAARHHSSVDRVDD